MEIYFYSVIRGELLAKLVNSVQKQNCFLLKKYGNCLMKSKNLKEWSLIPKEISLSPLIQKREDLTFSFSQILKCNLMAFKPKNALENRQVIPPYCKYTRLLKLKK